MGPKAAGMWGVWSLSQDLDTRAVNTIRFLAIDAVEKANAGHPGRPMGAAAMAYVLWTRFLRFNPKNPKWPDRDRFILSAGHGSMLLYALLYLTGYDLSLDDLKEFRHYGSLTPGHPEYGHTAGVEATTGPLGQGFANGVGMAIAQRELEARFGRPEHRLIDHTIYAIVSDGDLMEGISSEAGSLAGHLKLGRLVYLYDDNHISIEGSTEIAFSEDVTMRFEAYGWHVQSVADGNDLEAIEKAIGAAKAETDRPSLIRVRTHLAWGSPNKHDNASAHGSPLGADETRLTKEALDWPLTPDFYVPEDVLLHFRQAVTRGAAWEREWNARLDAYRRAFPAEARALEAAFRRTLPSDLEEKVPSFEIGKGIATRSASGETLQALAAAIPELVGGSADLAPSNDTYLKGLGDLSAKTDGRNLHFGVREHAMGAILNGMAYHGGVIPYGGTFLVFSDYMRTPIRLASLSHLPVTFVFTHDSIALGEDGPTHQPIEQLASLRAMPGLTVIRPADAVETAYGWCQALRQDHGPTAMILTRQKLPVLRRPEGLDMAEAMTRGAYVLSDDGGTPDLLLIGTGSEVSLLVEAATRLRAEGLGVRVVSMPSWELFEAQDASYHESVLPSSVKARVTVELAATVGWERYAGDEGATLGVDRYGASGAIEDLLPAYGFTPEHVVELAHEVLSRPASARR